MNILICDDMPEEAKGLDELLHNSGFAVTTAIYQSGKKVLEHLSAGAVADVCFLDIVMPEMDGIELAQELRGRGFTGSIVFLTISKEYGHETYKVKAFDYLLKPPTLHDVIDVLSRLKKVRDEGDTQGILVRTTGISRFVMFREISYVEVISHKVYYRLKDGGTVEERTTFAEAVPLVLSDPRFIQCHRSYIVNMDDVWAVSGKEFIMQSGAKIPLSRSFPDAKKKYLKRVVFGVINNE